MAKINPKIAALIFINLALSGAIGLLFKDLAATGLSLNSPLKWVFLFLALLSASSFLTVFALVVRDGLRLWRWGGYFLSALGFTFPFLLPPPILPSSSIYYFYLLFLLPLIYLAGLFFLDRAVSGSLATFAIFAARIFSKAFSRFFLALILLSGLLTYLLVAPTGKVEVKSLLEPIIRPIADQVVDAFVVRPIRQQLGRDLTDTEFAAVVSGSGILDSFDQIGLTVNKAQIKSPQTLSAALTSAALDKLDQQLTQLFGPYLVFVPLLLAAATALTFLMFLPILTPLATLSFAIIYRILVFVKLLQFVEEERIVRVLKLA